MGFAALSLALFCGLLLPPAARSAVLIDFNTVGQLTNNFGVRSTVANAGSVAVWYEVTNGGVANSGALDGVSGSANDNTLTYLPVSFPWPSTGVGVTLNASMVFKGKSVAATGSPGIGLGFINVTNGAMEANTLAWQGNWVGFRLIPNSATNFSLGGIALSPATNVSFPAVGVALFTNASQFTNFFRLSATFTRTNGTNITIAGKMEDLGPNGTTLLSNALTLAPLTLTNVGFSSGDVFYGAVRVAENRGADFLDEFAFWNTNGTPVITAPPASLVVTANRPATFNVGVDGTPGFSYTWYTNGTVVPGATASSFTIARASVSLASVKVAITNALGGLESPETTLIVNADGDAPTLVSIGSLDGLTVGVAFSEAVDPATATNIGNYSVNSGGPVASATLRPDGQTVALRLATAASGNLIVTVNNVKDLAGNTIALGAQTNGTVLGLIPADIASPMTAGSSFTANTGDIDMTGGGLDLWNSTDQGHAALGWRTGDFDVKVRVQNIQFARPFNTVATGRESATKVGLMARETIDASARMFTHTVQPPDFTMPVGGNVLQVQQRATPNVAAVQIGGNTALPVNGAWGNNLWLRLRRVNNTFTAYYATNATPGIWTVVQQTNSFMTNAMLVGLTACAHWDDMNYASGVQFRSYGDMTYASPTVNITGNLPSSTNLVLIGITNLLSQTLTLAVTALATVAPASELQYTWQRWSGASFTNIPTASAASASYVTPVLTLADNGAQFRVIVSVPGASSISAVCTVNISESVPALANVLGCYPGGNYFTVFFNEPLDPSTATNLANYTITNSLGQTISLTGALLLQPAFNATNSYRVVLTTSVPLTNGTTYTVVVNNVKDATGLTIAANALKSFAEPIVTMPPITIELYNLNNLPGMNVSDLTNNSRFINNIADSRFYTSNLFGYNTTMAGPSGVNMTNYGGRIWSYFVAPSNSDYRFFIKSDDGGMLFMNTNALNSLDPLGKILIASNAPGTTNGIARNYYTNDSSMSVAINLLSNQAYYIEAEWKQSNYIDGFALAVTNNAITNGYPAGVPDPTAVAGASLFRGAPANVMVEQFTGLSTSDQTVAGLTNAQRFQANAPDTVLYTNVFGYDWAINNVLAYADSLQGYGVRLSAYFVAPSNAWYRFWIRSDDFSQLFMNTNAVNSTDAVGKVSIATLGAPHTYYFNDSSMSTNVFLVGGQQYYMEGLFKEGGGGDGFGLAWRSSPTTWVPTANPPTNDIALGTVFTLPTGPVSCSAVSMSVPFASEGGTITFAISNLAGALPYGVQWKSNGVPIVGATGFAYTTPALGSNAVGAVYSVAVNNPFGMIEKAAPTPAIVALDVTWPVVTSATGSGFLTNVYVSFSEAVSVATATNPANYVIPGLTVLSAAIVANTSVIDLYTTPQTPGTIYTLTVSGVQDRAALANTVGTNNVVTFTAFVTTRGFVRVDRFDNIGGGTVSLLEGAPKFLANQPDLVVFNNYFGYLYTAALNSAVADNFGTRVSALFIPPSNGVYRFYIRSDDCSSLYLNTNSVNSTDPAGAVIIAAQNFTGTYVNRDYGNLANGPVVSVGIPLVGGQFYYMEGRHKEGSSSEGFGMAFREQGDSSTPPNTEVASGIFFATPGNPDLSTNLVITRQPVGATLSGRAPYTMYVAAAAAGTFTTLNYQWQSWNGSAWTDIVGAVTNSLSVVPTTTTQYRALVSTAGRVTNSSTATVVVSDLPPALAGVSGLNAQSNVTAFFSEMVTPGSANNLANYTLTNNFGNTYAITSAVLQADQMSVLLGVSGLLFGGNLTNYTLVANNIVDLDASPKTATSAFTFYVADKKLHADRYAMTASVWPVPTGVPTTGDVVTTEFYYGPNVDNAANNNYIARVYGYFIPPSNGLYRFFIRSDDESEFWMNTNDVNSASPNGLMKLAYSPQSGQSYSLASAQTPFIAMRAGQRYYMEGQYREGSGGDWITVTVREYRNNTIPADAERMPASLFSQPEGLMINLGNMAFAESSVGAQIKPTFSAIPNYGTFASNNLSYQWYSNGMAIAGATSMTGPLPSPLSTEANGWVYTLVAYNTTLGVVGSNAAVLSVASSNAIVVSQPQNLVVGVSNDAMFSVTAGGSGLGYYWYSNGVLVSVAGPTYTIPRAGAGSSGQFQVVVSNAWGMATSQVAQLTVQPFAAVALDFNTIGQLTNNFVMRNKAGNQGSVWSEVTSGGFINTGALDGVNNNANDNTVTYVTDGFPTVTSSPSETLTISLMFKGKTPNAGNVAQNPQVQLGFISSTNAYMETNHNNLWAGNWMALRTAIATNATNFFMEGGVYGVNLTGSTNFYTNSYSASTNAWVTNGNMLVNWYRLTATFVRSYGTNVTISGLMEDLGATGLSAPITRVAFGPTSYVNSNFVQSTLYPAFRVIENYGVDYLDNFMVYRLNGAPYLTRGLADQAVSTYRAASFAAKADGLPPFSYQWFTNGMAVAGATNAAYTTPLLTAAGSLTVTVGVTNSVGGILSPNATVTTTPDSTAPALLSVGSVDGRIVGVTFSEPVSSATALNTNNYIVTGSAVVGAALRPDGQTVALTLAGPISGGFSVTVNNVTDLSGIPIASSSSLTGSVIGLTGFDVGNPMTWGSDFTSTNGDILVTAGGTDIYNTADSGHLTMAWRTGDFDVKVRVESVSRVRPFNINTGRDEYARAHLMMRESSLASSRMLAIGTYGADFGMPMQLDAIPVVVRATTLAGATTAVTANQASNGGYFPNLWLRMRRVNNTFTTYYATNANPTVWTILNIQSGMVMSNTVLVGLATSAHFDSASYAASAQYRSFGDVTNPAAQLYTLMDLPAATNVTYANGTALPTVAFTCSMAVTNALTWEVQYVWQRSDGLGGFTNIPTAAAAATTANQAVSGTFTTPGLTPDDNGAQFRAIAKVTGSLSVTSTVCTVTVIDAATTLNGAVAYYTGSNAVLLSFQETLDPTSATNLNNYVFNAYPPMTVTSAIYLPPVGTAVPPATGVGGTRVLLFTSQPLYAGFGYAVQINGLRDVNNTLIPAYSARTVALTQTNGPAMVELFLNNGALSTVPDLTNTVKYQASLPDTVIFTNYFGFNRSLVDFGLNTYGGRVSALFVAPSNGSYRFFIKGDDGFAFYMNTNALNSTDPTRKVQLTYSGGNYTYYTNILTTNMTTNVTLVGGQKYYIEALWKENGGGDGVAVCVTNSDFTGALTNLDWFIPASQLELPVGPVGVSDILVTGTPVVGQAITLSVSNLTGALPFAMQWKSNGVPVATPAGRMATYTTAPLKAGEVYSMFVNNPFSTVEKSVTPIAADVTRPTVVRITGSAFLTNVTIGFSEAVTNSTASVAANYQIAGLPVYGAWLKPDGSNVVLATAPQTPGTTYTVVINNIRDCSLNANVIATDTTTNFTAWTLCARGYVTVDFFTNLAVLPNLYTLPGEMKFAMNAVDLTTNAGVFAWNTNGAGVFGTFLDGYGTRTYGWFVPPSNGVYRFYVRQDDTSVLYMNTNYASGLDPAGKVVIAGSLTAGAVYNDTANPSMSPNIALSSDQVYYIEMLQREGNGGDGLSLAFREQADTSVPATTEVAQGRFFRNYGDPYLSALSIVSNPFDTNNVSEGNPITLTCAAAVVPSSLPAFYQWQKDRGDGVFTNLPGMIGTNVQVPALGGSTLHYRCEVSSVSHTLYTTTNTVQTLLDLTAPSVAKVTGGPADNMLTVSFSEIIDPVSALALTNYSFSEGITALHARMDGTTNVVLTTTIQPPGYHSVTVSTNVVDASYSANRIPAGATVVFGTWSMSPAAKYERFGPDASIGAGFATLQAYPGYINNLPSMTAYTNVLGCNLNGAGGFVGALDNYGGRVSGYFMAPSNGNYRFYVRSDDDSRLFLNTNAINSTDPAFKVLLASDTGANRAYLDYTPFIPLVAGQRYYIEAVFSEGTGGEGVSATVREQNDLTPLNIAEVILPLVGGDPALNSVTFVTNPPPSTNVMENSALVLPVWANNLLGMTQLTWYQWQKEGLGGVFTNIPNATNTFTARARMLLSDAGNYRCLASFPGAVATSMVCSVTVDADIIVPTVLFAVQDNTLPNVTPSRVRVLFSEWVDAVTGTNKDNYTLDGGALVTNVLYNTNYVILQASGLQPGSNYTVAVQNLNDLASTPNMMGATNVGFRCFAAITNGVVRRERFNTPTFTDGRDRAVGYLLTDPKYTNNVPDVVDYLTPWNSQTLGDQYGLRMTGFLIPPASGTYTFATLSDDASRFYISTNDEPANLRLAATIADGSCCVTTYGTPIALEAGRAYYIEGQMKEGTGGDYFTVTWNNPAIHGASYVAFPSTNIFFGETPQWTLSVTSQPPAIYVIEEQHPAIFTVGAYSWQPGIAYQWYSNSVSLAGQTNNTFAFNSLPPLFSATVSCMVTARVENGAMAGGTYTRWYAVTSALSVLTDSTAPVVAQVTGNETLTNVLLTFSERINSAAAQNVANYAISDGVNPLPILGATQLADGSNIVLHTALQTPGVVYYVTNNNIVDLATTPNPLAPNTTVPFTAWMVLPGMLAVDVYANLPGGAVTDLANLMSKAATNAPDLRTTIRSFDWHTMPMPFTAGGLQNYGVKVWGWFQPPTNGFYTFYIRGDDATKLYMNTNGVTPAGKVLLAQDDFGGHSYTNGTNIATGNASANISPAISLTNGTSYYIEGWMKQSNAIEFLQVDFRASGDAIPQAPSTQGGGGYPGPYLTNAFYPGNEVASGAYFGLAYNPATFASVVTFSQQPIDSTNVALGQAVSLSALASATPVPTNNYVSYQWQTSSDGSTWSDATPPPTNYNCDYAMLGVGTNYTANYYYSTSVRVVARAFPSGISATSSVATVTVPDGLNVVSIGSLDGTSVVVVFDRPVSVTGDYSAVASTSYTFNGGLEANSATLRPDGRSVVVVPGSPLSGTFSLTLTYINDVTESFTCETTVYGTVLAPSFASDVGLTPGTGDPLLRGSAASTIANGVDVVAGGSDMWNAADGMYYVAWPITGNFDVRVRVPSITNNIVVAPNTWSKAGLMARVSTNANSREMSIVTTPPSLPNTPNSGQNLTAFQYRDTAGAASLSSYYTSATMPAWVGTNSPWVRLVRTNSVFSGYWSSNGVNWLQVSNRDATVNGGAYPDTILVGLATTAHNNFSNRVTSTVQAQYRDLYKLTPPTVSVATDTPGISLYGSALFTATIIDDPYPPTPDNPRWIKWLDNGVEVVGSNDMVLTFPRALVAGVHTITALVGNNGGATPAVAYLTVTNALPFVNPVTLIATQNVARTFSISADLLAGDYDPEGDPLSLLLVSSNAVRFVTDFDSGLPSGTAVYGNAVVTNADGFTGGCLKLTPAAATQNGAFFVNDFASGQPVYGFKADFKLLVANGTANPADGFSFVFGTNLPNAVFPVGEDGIGNNLIVSFDNYDNAAASTDGAYPAPSVEVRWGGNTTNYNIGYYFLGSKYTNMNWQNVQINLKPGGLLDVTLGTNVIFSNLPTPYTNGNILSGGQFAVGARCGGQYETHWIDNLSIEAIVGPNGTGFGVAPAAGTIVECSSDLGGVVSKNGDVLSYTPPGISVCGPDIIRFLVNDGQVGGSTFSFATVTLADRTGPTLATANIVTNAAGSSRVVNYTASAVDNCDGSPVVIACVPPSGTVFALGTNTVTCTSYDVSLNTNSGTFTVTVESLVTGAVALEGYAGPAGSGNGLRLVTFTGTDAGGQVTRQWNTSLTFALGVANYSLSVPLGTANLSAKTAWNLRIRQSVSLAGGPVVANFTGTATLPAGDANNSNGVDLADYYALVAAWYTANSAADLDGNGRVDLDDYFLLANRWLETGDPQ